MTLSTPSASTVTVDFATRDGTATIADDDYRRRTGRLSFAPGETRMNALVPVVGDTRVEPDERLLVELSNPVGAGLDDAQATLTIRNDDDAPGEIRLVGEPRVGEGAGSAVITVERAGGGDGPAAVDFGTADGTATAGEDYRSAAGRLSWADGDVGARTFTIRILDDNRSEPDETVAIVLSNPSGASLAGPDRTELTILDDDQPARLEAVGDTTITDTVDGEIGLRALATRAARRSRAPRSSGRSPRATPSFSTAPRRRPTPTAWRPSGSSSAARRGGWWLPPGSRPRGRS